MMQLSREALLGAYRQMATIREFEERLHAEIQTGEIAGFTHLYCGQEAVAVGVCDHLDDDDYDRLHPSRPRPLHRQGLRREGDDAGDLRQGRRALQGQGRLDAHRRSSQGMLGANGIVGAGAPLAVGAAIASKLDGKGSVAIAFSGDGACNQGTTFEAMNMAVVLKAPAIFVFENNHYSEHTGVDYAVGTSDRHRRPRRGVRHEGWRADGCDFFDIYEAMREVLDYVRAGGGPAAVELDTERFYGHFEGDPQRYRGPASSTASATSATASRPSASRRPTPSCSRRPTSTRSTPRSPR